MLFFRVLAKLYLFAAMFLLLSPIPAASQSADDAGAIPRTAEGRPNFQGVWANNSATPLERPGQLEGKESFTEEEVASLEAAADRLFGGADDAGFADGVFQAALADVTEVNSVCTGTGNYSSVWMVDRDFDNRTSLITTPSNGRLPGTTEAAKTRQAAARAQRQEARSQPGGGYNGPEDIPLQSRCISFGMPRVGGLGAGYNSYYQIFQTGNHLVMLGELIHDARVIAIADRPHMSSSIRQWHGDAVAHWDGDTLVVETTNFDPKSSYRGSSENLHLIERLTLASPAALHYEITVTDPTTWNAPWTALVILKKTEDAIYEYACHEGNIGMEGILTGSRTEEAAAQASETRR